MTGEPVATLPAPNPLPPSVLDRARGLVVPELRRAVATLHPLLRTPVEYHFGWVDADGMPSEASGGKAVRPALAVLGAEAAGADAALAVPAAVAIELVHNFSLVHDDIMDGDRTRRHRRTVWDVYGVADAIIVGDALQTLAMDVLLRDPTPRAAAALRTLVRGTAEMIGGQADDTALERDPNGSVAACQEMHRGKTAALLGAAVSMGAQLGGAGERLVAALDRYAVELGLSFQAVDDLLGIWGDPAVTGKPAGNDLRERKCSLPVAVALEAGGPLAARLREAFAGEMTAPVIAELAERLAAAGVDRRVDAMARDHLGAALAALDAEPIAADARDELCELAHFVVDRRH